MRYGNSFGEKHGKNDWYRQIGKEVGEMRNVFEDKTVILRLSRNINSSDDGELVLAGNRRRLPEKGCRISGESQPFRNVWTEGEREWMKKSFSERRRRD